MSNNKYTKDQLDDTEIMELSEETIERIVCKQLLNPCSLDNTAFVRQHFHPGWFQNGNIKELFSFLLKYWKRYESAPSLTLVNEILMNDHFEENRSVLKKLVNELFEFKEETLNPKFVQDSIIDFTKGRAVYHAILDNIEDIENRGDIRNCLSRLEDIVKIGISDDLGIEYFENLNNHIKDLTNKESRTPFNWKEWDKFTYGGIPVGEACLFMIMAQPGLGKSQVMMNIGYNWLLQNKNVLMVSLEMSEKMYSRRMSALFTDINVNALKDHTEVVLKRVTTTKLSIPGARLYIKQYSPNEFNSAKLKHLLNKYKELKGFVPDLIIVDYLNIMSPNGNSNGMKSYERVGAISKELRSVSIETKIPIVSATQANRGNSGYAGEEISMNNTSDSSAINMDADAIFALYQLEGERELGRINIKILKNRLGGFVETIFPMSVNYETLKITDWDGSGEVDTDVSNEVFQTEQSQTNTSTGKDKTPVDILFEN